MNNVKKGVTIGYVNGDAPFSREVEPRSVAELTAEVERLREALRLMYAHYHADSGSELVATYEKAVRGE